jgi:isopentenyldiphosphate isomerase
VITRDQRIRYRPVEKRLWVEHGVRGFVLTGRDSQSTVASLAVLEHQWSHIEQLVIDEPSGPWMYALTTAGLRQILL